MWINACAVCHQFRTVGQMAPMRSVLSTDQGALRLPWSDVIVDCQGPFTRGAQGNCYVLSYHCTFLGVPKLEPFERLDKPTFNRALVACVMRARRVADVVRTDRGPEMTSAITEEFLKLCNTRQYLGAAFTPRHQGPGERELIKRFLLSGSFLYTRCAKRFRRNGTS